MSLLDELLTTAVKNSYEKNKRQPEPSILGALKDPQFLQDMKRGVLDSVNRGAVASTIGGPVDLATMALRPLGYNVEKPAWGSEWVGDKMQQMGLLGDYRNPIAESLASVAVPGAMAKVAPKVFQAEQAAIQNANIAGPLSDGKFATQRGVFGGLNAKTADKAKLSQAEQMLKKGVDPAQVWKETGWGRGPDGKWRFEIPDNKAELKSTPLPTREMDGKAYEDFKLYDALKHDALASAYPDTANISGSFRTNGTNGAAYNGALDHISYDKMLRNGIPSAEQLAAKEAADSALGAHVSSPRHRRLEGLLEANIDNEPEFNRIFNKYGGAADEKETSRLAGASNAARQSILEQPAGGAYLGGDSAKSTTLHELQHAIQQREGFARGGSPGSNGLSYDDLTASARKAYESSRTTYDDPLLAELYAGEKPLKPWDEMNKIERIPYYEQAQMGAYQRLGGEAEARLVQSRMNLTPEERAAQYPWNPDYFKQQTGVGLDDLIHRFDGGEAKSVGFTYPQDAALETARKNGVKMLGLPENNTALDRANILYPESGFHGTRHYSMVDESGEMTNRDGIKSFVPGLRKLTFSSSGPEFANGYAAERNGAEKLSGAVYPLRINAGKTFDYQNPTHVDALVKDLPFDTDYKWSALYKKSPDEIHKSISSGDWSVIEDPDVMDAIKRQGFNSLNVFETGAKNLGVFSPSQVRSPFAAFDPARIHENDLLAGAMPFGLLLDPENRAKLGN